MNSWAAQSESQEEHQDSTPRTYICFCEKKFTTYPGIYLHMKSKHNNLFHKYKKLKITKLFRKTFDEKGGEIHRLQKISQNEINPHERTRITEIDNRNNLGLRAVSQREQRHPRKNGHIPSKNKSQQQNNHQFPVRFHPEMHRNMMNHVVGHHPHFPMPTGIPSMPGVPSMSSISSEQMPFGMTIPSHVPPMFMQHNPFMGSGQHQQRPTLKKQFQRFLFESNFTQKSIIKKSIYNLMVFIDKNYSSINDPRIGNRTFLSYCDQFDHTYVLPLIHQRISELKEMMREDGGELHLEVNCIIRFTNCISDMLSMQYGGKRSYPLKEVDPVKNYSSIVEDKGEVIDKSILIDSDKREEDGVSK